MRVDVGTHAEIVLGNNRCLLACSGPTGLAFVGAQISGGQRAAPGAIERERIDRATLEPRYSVIGCELWSDDPGFAEAVVASGVTGICGSGIIELVAEPYLAGLIRHDGSLVPRSPRVQADARTFSSELRAAHDGNAALRITQNDVRAIQLAKAALHAGVALLRERLSAERVDRDRLAVTFDSHVDVKYAMELGMIADCALDQVSSGGNAAGTGARIALLNQCARRDIEALVRRVEKIETAVEPHFRQLFVEAIATPHLSAAYTQLRQLVELPPRRRRFMSRRRARVTSAAAQHGPGPCTAPAHWPTKRVKPSCRDNISRH
jgi:uncharacterized 2Fe-2S/4Fe-4S cluster protein (DUF4445 family)